MTGLKMETERLVVLEDGIVIGYVTPGDTLDITSDELGPHHLIRIEVLHKKQAAKFRSHGLIAKIRGLFQRHERVKLEKTTPSEWPDEIE